MNDAGELLNILMWPMIACVILTGIHCYLGIHVLMREVLFVDLALAQVAALGAAAGAFIGVSVESTGNYFFALGFTMVGAALFALGRFRDRRVPQEAVIGIVYAVSSAAAILVLSKSATERDEIEQMLTGNLLWVGRHEVVKTALIYSLVALVHIVFARRFFALSRAQTLDGGRDKLWDFLFYATFGVVVTSSVKMAGVLLVFCYLIVPASCAMLFFRGVRARLLAGWTIGLLGSLGGLTIAAVWDFPVGPSVVAVFGAVFAIGAAMSAIAPRARTG
ncbi:MAG: metal ABC transporter permease [Phycisphaeraceae bacterium]|nr:metal ABC transporter permease [Phycisphaeraceae bacterium]